MRIRVSSKDDCERLCAILSGNGYFVNAKYKASTLTRPVRRNWTITFFSPRELMGALRDKEEYAK